MMFFFFKCIVYIVFIDFSYVNVFMEVYVVIYIFNKKKLFDILKIYSCGFFIIDCILIGYFLDVVF